TYSNAAKTRLLGVPATLIERHGAVSAEVAKAMAAGALACSEATWAAAVTGVAGPDGGSADKPVGTVWCAWAGPGLAPQAKAFALPGNRSQVRGASAAAVIDGLLARLGS
ncbi:MAG: nicotinamide-nucleotide amidohydrolase family protein, partial [Salinisphaera sp.]|nr:nicotinamide-nucleotide amidohydrolase family protein [Salinisphaera sp.]